MIDYFDFLYERVTSGVKVSIAGRRLCKILDAIDVEPSCLDETRIEDMQNARQEYVWLHGEELFDDEIAEVLGSEHTVFELLATLAIKIEDKVMSNPIYGDRTSVWFWVMIENLDILPENVVLSDGRMDVDYIARVCVRWLDGQFQKNGDGSPFPLRNPPDDARNVDMWRLAMWYFNENYEGKW